MKIQKNNQAGFSLVELMVVVAIIGILATIAIPRVNRYMAKARTSEAQVNLGSIYTSNKAFFVEFSSFSSMFGAIGYSPEGRLRYNVGFVTAAFPAPLFFTARGKLFPVANNANIDAVTFCPGTLPVACNMLAGSGGAAPPAIPGTAIVQASTFFAGAIANITGAAGNNDIWQIDNNKNLNNTFDGTLL